MADTTGTGVGDDIMGTSGSDSLDGAGGDDWIQSLQGDDILVGGSGRDALWASNGWDDMTGGVESDTYHVDSYFDTITEVAGALEGDNDRVNTYITLDLLNDPGVMGQDIEDMRLVGFDPIDGYGNAKDNWIEGNNEVNTIGGGDGNDTLDGWDGTDTLLGGNGDDTFILDHSSDMLDVVDGGADSNTVKIAFHANLSTLMGGVTTTLNTALNWTNIQNITLTGTATLSATGDNNVNTLTGNDVANKLMGLDGNDTLDGGMGADSLVGGLGDDTYLVDNTTDKVVDLVGGGTDTVIATVSYVLPTSGTASEVENLTLDDDGGAINGTGNALGNVITGNTSKNILKGMGGADTISGGEGADTIDGGAGIDTHVGGLGADLYAIDNVLDVVTEALNEGIDKINATFVAGAAYVLPSDVENLTLLGTLGSQTVTGNGLDNLLVGNTANNTFAGLAGLDSLNGGSGNDVLSGGDDNDTIDGGIGIDTLDGGLGDDTFMVDSSSDVIIEAAAEGKDLVKATVSYSIAGSPNADDLTLIGGALAGTGNDLANTITGNALKNTLSGGLGDDSISGGIGDDIINGGDSADSLDGGAGLDTMTGGLGDDIFQVDNVKDIVIEAAGQGTDLVKSTADFTLGANVENLTLQGGTIGAGNALNNIIIGNGGRNVLSGFDGDDILDGDAGNDTLNGGNGTDTLVGGDGNDTMDGGTGDDTLTGGLGDDVLYVDSLADVVNENAAEGSDTVFSTVTYSLSGGAAEIENLTLTGVAAIDGTGNAYNNILTGNSALNTLTGGLGDDGYVVDNTVDILVEAGGEGTDTVYSTVTFDLAAAYLLGAELENLVLGPVCGCGIFNIDGYGTAANNTLTGNAGNNTLYGRAGDDVYIATQGVDLLVELTGEGTDTVKSSFTYTLSPTSATYEIENLTLTSGDISGTGNDLNNVITGSTGNNTLDGGTGDDALIGGLGNDTYIVDSATLDIVTEGAGEGIDTVRASVTYNLGVNAAETENLTLTGVANIDGTGTGLDNILVGNTGNNVLTALGGNDTLDGGGGIDTLDGGAGNDVFFIRAGTERILEAAGEGTDIVRTSVNFNLNLVANIDEVEQLFALGDLNVNITGNDFANTITGNKGTNILNGAGGNDTLDGGAGADTLIGGAGDDTFIVTNVTGTKLFDAVGEGIDTIKVSGSYTLATLPATLELENITLTGSGAFTATGNAAVNILIGNGSANTLNGGAGADTMDGGGGNDIMYIDDSLDFLAELGGAGIDTAYSSVTFDLSTRGTEVERLILTGTADIDGTGNALDNTLTGNTGNNVLTGGAGKDTYFIQNVGDTVVEGASAPLERDIIFSTVTHTMEAEVEDMTLTGTALINGTGNTLDNTIQGNSAVNILSGDDGDDVLGASTGDTLVGGAGSDTALTSFTANLATLTASTLWNSIENITLAGTAIIHAFGDAGTNTLTGNTAANTLNGAGGTDTLIGKGGNDVYIVDDASVVIDEVTEGGGKDIVKSTVTYTLATGVDDLTLLGTANIDGTGNTGTNTIIGNSGNNALDGDAGADSMAGGLGNDTYTVDSTSDKLTDTGGVELVGSYVTWTLGTGFENLILLGADDINGTGNTGINTLVGNSGINTLDGGAGADRMVGGQEDDTYIIDTLGDIIVELGGEGDHDLIMSKLTYSLAAIANVEDLTLTGTASIHGTGNALDNIIRGNSASNTLIGGDGNDVLAGGDGKDYLYGGNGADVFLFEGESAFATIDVIKDFNPLEDVLQYNVLTGIDPLYDVNEDFVQHKIIGGDDYIYVDRDGVRGTEFGFRLLVIIDY